LLAPEDLSRMRERGAKGKDTMLCEEYDHEVPDEDKGRLHGQKTSTSKAEEMLLRVRCGNFRRWRDRLQVSFQMTAPRREQSSDEGEELLVLFNFIW